MSANVLTRGSVGATVASVDLPATFLDYAGGNPAKAVGTGNHAGRLPLAIRPSLRRLMENISISGKIPRW